MLKMIYKKEGDLIHIMSQVSLIIFIDEFGDDILAKKPKSTYGFGYFICRKEDVDTLNKDLINCISQKIHLRECTGKEDLKQTVQKVSSFLKNCTKEFHAGGVVCSNQQLRSEIKKNINLSPPPSPSVNYNKIYSHLPILETIESLKYVYLALALKYELSLK